MKKGIIFTLFCLMTINVIGQNRKSNNYIYTHNLKPSIASESKNKFSTYLVNSPYKSLVDEYTTSRYLTPWCYTNNSAKSLYAIEYKTSEVSPIYNEDGSVKIINMVMYYNYNVKVIISDQSGNIVSERELTLMNENNTLLVDNPLLVSDIKKGNKTVIADYINKNLPFIYKESLLNSRDYINTAFCGKSGIDTFYVYSAKGKTYDYSELEAITETFKVIMSSFLTKKVDSSQVIEMIKKTIPVWEKELATADFINPDARISKEVALGLYYNLATGYFFLKDYEKAYEYIQKTYKKEDENSKKLLIRGDFENRALKFERTIFTYWNK